MAPLSQHEQGGPGVLAGLVGARDTDRRTFIKKTGVAAAVLATAAACTEEAFSPTSALSAGDASFADVPLGSGDVGILNYAYALEQLEARFYEVVVTQRYTGMTDYEYRTLLDIRDHEIVHREFFKAALGAAAIPSLAFNLSSVNLTSRASVLAAAMTFEDLGVAAYNGAGQLLTNPEYLTAAGKIVSVEARHASGIRLLISLFQDSTGFSRFAAGDGLVDAQGLDRAMTPAQVLAAAAPFFTDRLIATGLPTS